MDNKRLKDISKNKLFKSFLRGRLALLPIIVILLLFFVILLLLGISAPIYFVFSGALLLLIICLIVFQAVDLLFSLHALAELSNEELAKLQKYCIDGRKGRNVIGMYTEFGLLTNSSFIPYDEIVKLKYVSQKWYYNLDFDSFKPVETIPPKVKITRERELFGKKRKYTASYYLPEHKNVYGELTRLTEEIRSRTKKEITVENNYVFRNIQ